MHTQCRVGQSELTIATTNDTCKTRSSTLHSGAVAPVEQSEPPPLQSAWLIVDSIPSNLRPHPWRMLRVESLVIEATARQKGRDATGQSKM